MIKIAPSILAADFGQLAKDAKRAEDAGADFLHVDVMDGHFVPNITIGPIVVEALKKAVSIPLDVHLMIKHPYKYAKAFIDAGADILTVHAEAEHNIIETLEFIKSKNVKCGPAVNPDKSIDTIKPILHLCDIVLIMSVFPGFGGQAFIPTVLSKVEELHRLRNENGYHYKIEIDGGINLNTIKVAKQAGIDIAVAGTAIYGASDIKSVILTMKNL